MRALGYRSLLASPIAHLFAHEFSWTQIGKKILLHNVHFKSPPPYFQIDDIEVACDDEHSDETRHDGCGCVHSRYDRKQYACQKYSLPGTVFLFTNFTYVSGCRQNFEKLEKGGNDEINSWMSMIKDPPSKIKK